VLDTNSPVPLYFQLKSYIQNQISSGGWKPGEQIPSEAELCRKFQISRTTIRQAISELVTQGKLKRTQGRGTFVAQYNIEKSLFFLAGFSAEMKMRGLKPSSKVLKFDTIPPSDLIVQRLQLKENEPVIFLRRLRLADGQLIAIHNCYLPFNRFFSIIHENPEDSLISLLQNKFNTIAVRSIRTIESISCPAPEAKLLDIEVGFSILYDKGTIFDQNDQPFEYDECFYRGDRFSFNIEIINQQDHYSKYLPPLS
jgi:GntR family transcriptional regulator